ncbi:MAG: polysaccharide biosynthesis tyrosine autokinase [Actinobacteria bacterium]|nr:polysaccharide biosynthesis tyrosine autokinase [Actinomycetota bacterium]
MRSELSRLDIQQTRLQQRALRDEIIEVEASTPGGPQKQPLLREYLRIILSRFWLALGIFVISVAVSIVYLSTRTKMYQATRTVLIQPSSPRLTEITPVYDERGFGLGSTESFLNTQYKLMVSRPVLEATFNDPQLGLASLPQFQTADPLKAFAKYFKVSPVELTRLVNVSFTWSEPVLAARVVNKLVDYYIEDYRHRSLGVTRAGLETLVDQARKLRPAADEATRNKYKFMKEHNLASLEKDQDVTSQRLKDISQILTRLGSERIQWESRMYSIQDVLKREGSAEWLPEVVNSDTMRALKLSLIKSQQQHADLLGRLGPNHAAVITAAQKIETIQEKMAAEARAILAAATAQYDRILRQEKEHREKLAAENKKVIEFSGIKMEYEQICKEAESKNADAEGVEKRIKEIELSLATGSKEDSIFPLGEAHPPAKPYSPRKRAYIFMGGFIGLILAVGTCFLLDYLDTTIRTREDVEQLLGLPVLGYVPSLESETRGSRVVGQTNRRRDFLAVDEPHSILAESFRSIRTALSLSGNGQRGTTLIAVTSASPKEGKSIVSINLALALARSGKKVLVVDADMRKPRLHKSFQTNPHPGLSNLLAGQRDVPLALAIRATDVANLSLLPSGPIPPNPAELLDSPMFGQLIGSLPADLDYVIFDTPPAGNVTDAVIVAAHMHRTILVVRSFQTQKNVLSRVAQMLQMAQGPSRSVILNNADVPRGAYGYYDNYYYYQSRYYYYGEGNERRRKRKKKTRTGKHHSGPSAKSASKEESVVSAAEPVGSQA